MKARECLWVALLALPVWTSAAEPAKPGFDLRNESVQGILRTAAAASESTEALTPKNESKVQAELADIRFRAPRRVHHTQCDGEDCVAYSADNEALFSMDRQFSNAIDPMASGKREDGWLSCQDTHNLLSTFERYDRCRGIRIGAPPLTVGNLGVELPKIRL